MQPIEFWTKYQLKEDLAYHWRAGPLQVWMRRTNRDWHIADKTDSIRCELSQSPLPDHNIDISKLDWKRWAFNVPHTELETMPCMPDRPIVVKTRLPTTLPPGVRASFFISLPVWVALSVYENTKKVELIKIASTVLSNTWFGDPFEGELCYALKSRALREKENLGYDYNRAICKFTIRNESEEPLPIQRICVRTKHLGIFAGTDRLWTNEIIVTIKGDGAPNKLDYKKSPPPDLSDPILLKSAEDEPEDNFFIRTFSNHILGLF